MLDSTTGSATSRLQINILNQSFIWMSIGLCVTAFCSLFVAASPTLLQAVFGNPLIFYGLMIGEIALVFFLSLRVTAMSYSTAVFCFFVYALLNGVTLSVIFLAYTSTSIATTFFAAASLFGAMAVYGFTTKRDLTTIGNLAFMGLIGVILASLVNIFLQSSVFSYVVSYLSIAIFIGLTAYDTQKLKRMSSVSSSPNLGILGALMLYLDFINIFLNLLRILGRRRS